MNSYQESLWEAFCWIETEAVERAAVLWDKSAAEDAYWCKLRTACRALAALMSEDKPAYTEKVFGLMAEAYIEEIE